MTYFIDISSPNICIIKKYVKILFCFYIKASICMNIYIFIYIYYIHIFFIVICIP